MEGDQDQERHVDEHGAVRVIPQYDGEDVSPTTNRELAGWYSYGWAAEVFVVCAMGAFLPITLEQMARDRGYLLSDPDIPCTPTWQMGAASSPAARRLLSTAASFLPLSRRHGAAAGVEATARSEGSQCFIWFLNHKLNTASFAMYTFSTSVAVQSLLIISMSAAADHGKFRKRLLLAFAFVGSASLMLFLGIPARFYLLAGLISIVSNTCFGASFVLLNSFLPLLVRHHPRVRAAVQQREEAAAAAAATEQTPLLQGLEARGADGGSGRTQGPPTTVPAARSAPSPSPSPSSAPALVAATVSAELALSTRISSWGIGIGYVGSLISLLISLGLVVATGSTTFSLRLALFGIGLWWFVFSIPAALYLRPRPGPPLLSEHGGGSGGGGGETPSWQAPTTWPSLRYLAFSWKSLARTARSVRYLKDVLLFLLAWFCLSDGIATVSGTAVLFAKTQLNMSVASLGMINVTAMLSGVAGAFLWNAASQRLRWSASQTIVACIVLFELIPLYGLLGFLRPVQAFGHFGLQESWEMYPLGAVYGVVMAGLSSYCRSFFGELIPPNFEASFYALYAITDKGSSIFGPAVVGWIIDKYGQIRPAFWFLAVLIALPLPLMMLVDVERGKRDAILLAEELEGRAASAGRVD
ncbi:Autophagy protein 22 [Ascosphaera acerosa]|nr:Autophagy protein 22 [Ascosphaera acerosa]